MAVEHYDVTLGAAATQVTSVRKGVRHATIQNYKLNDSIYVGTSTVTSTSYGHKILAGVSLPLGPFSDDAPLSTNEIYLFGTAAQVVHVLVETH